jgi:hypothetical protein
LTVLIDGSAAMENYKSEIVQALKGLPVFLDAKIVLVGDDTTVLSHFRSGASDYASALAQLEKFQFVGGHDDGDRRTFLRIDIVSSHPFLALLSPTST